MRGARRQSNKRASVRCGQASIRRPTFRISRMTGVTTLWGLRQADWRGLGVKGDGERGFPTPLLPVGVLLHALKFQLKGQTLRENARLHVDSTFHTPSP
jgi:hypothetical protein